MRLPNAPLVEVVFELHWDVQLTSVAGESPPFGYDPALHYFRETFKKAAAERGFSEYERFIQPGPTILNTIDSRFRRQKREPFPLLQIGPGVVACNLATDYEWDDFHKLCSLLLELLEETYPQTEVTPLNPNRIELRYIDHFGEGVIKSKSISKFLDDQTNLGSAIHQLLDGLPLQSDDSGHLAVRKEASEMPGSWFEFNIRTATSGGKQSGIGMVSKVVLEQGVDHIWRSGGREGILEWLSGAHDLTSAFFKRIMSDELMAAFREGQ